MAIDYGLYLITDRELLHGKDIKKAVEDAIKGGVTLVQVREKDVSTREFYNTALAVKQVTNYYNVPLIINDRLDIAQAVDAAGVHLGQSDMELTIARKILGDDKIIGISAGNVEEAKIAEENGADYIGVGAVFFTGTKKDIDKPIGVDGLRKVCSSVKIPKVGIGGINEKNAKDVLLAGADGLSVISAILGYDDINSAAARLKKIVDAVK